MANAHEQLTALLRQLPPISPVWVDYGINEIGVLRYYLIAGTYHEHSCFVSPNIYPALEDVFRNLTDKVTEHLGPDGLRWVYRVSEPLSREQALAKCRESVLRERGYNS
jgi:hypothetical protein